LHLGLKGNRVGDDIRFEAASPEDVSVFSEIQSFVFYGVLTSERFFETKSFSGFMGLAPYS